MQTKTKPVLVLRKGSIIATEQSCYFFYYVSTEKLLDHDICNLKQMKRQLGENTILATRVDRVIINPLNKMVFISFVFSKSGTLRLFFSFLKTAFLIHISFIFLLSSQISSTQICYICFIYNLFLGHMTKINFQHFQRLASFSLQKIPLLLHNLILLFYSSSISSTRLCFFFISIYFWWYGSLKIRIAQKKNSLTNLQVYDHNTFVFLKLE